MRNYTCPKCRNTCRCGQKKPASTTLIWPVVVLSLIALNGIIDGIRHEFALNPNLWWQILVFAGVLLISVITVILILANSPEIRDRERQNG